MVEQNKENIELPAIPVTAPKVTKTHCQQNLNSEDCKLDLINGLDTLNAFVLPLILVVLVITSLLKKQTSVINFVFGTVILGISLYSSIHISKYGLTEYLNEYPYTLAVLLIGFSLGVNLVSHLLTEQFHKPTQQFEPTPKPLIKDKEFKGEMEKLVVRLKEANELTTSLIELQATTESERDRYKGELAHIKERTEKALLKSESED